MFKDRQDAGRRLARFLITLAPARPVVLGIGTGGTLAAYEVAQALGAPLDGIRIRRIHAPGPYPAPIGAVAEGLPPVTVHCEDTIDDLGLASDALEAATTRAIAELGRPAAGERLPVQGRIAVLVGDAAVTGASARAAVRHVRRRGAARVVLALATAPADVAEELQDEVDELICLVRQDHHPRGPHLFFEDFRPVEESTAVRLLASARGVAGPL